MYLAAELVRCGWMELPRRRPRRQSV